MTKKKRELIEILLDNVKHEDWPEHFPYAVYGKKASECYATSEMPINHVSYWVMNDKPKCKLLFSSSEAPRYWNKTIVHRDEFMKRWNERNRAVDSEGWIQWNGGEMPVEKGTLIDVKYRCGIVNLHVRAGIDPSGGSIPHRCAVDFKHDDNQGDIIAYRLHVPQEQKTPQQLAMEKFGTDWHNNDGSCPVCDDVIIEVMHENGVKSDQQDKASEWLWGQLTGGWTISKWRIHSDEKEPQVDKAALLREPMPSCSEEIPCSFVDEKSATDTQIGGNHYAKLAIQPMQYSMKNKLDPLQHTIIKYVTRFRDKNGIEDLEKAKHCIDMLIEFEKENK